METRTTPAAGEFYRHFKGNLYQIIGVAKHSETGEEMVVYQALYGDFCLYTRPLAMFLSPVDKEKYPEAGQNYRFEKTVPQATAKKEEKQPEAPQETSNVTPPPCEERSAGEEIVREEILRFLDAEGDSEKLTVLHSLRRTMDEQLMTTIELSLDLLPDEKESLDRRYEFVERTLEQRIRFEGRRLR